MISKHKDSGIEWIGEIPEDWNIIKLKNECQFYNGYAFDSNDFKFDGNCSVVRIGDISQGTINLANCAKVQSDNKALEKYAILKDDIVIALSGATIGKVGYIDFAPEKTYINQRVAIIRGPINRLIYKWLNIGYISSNINLLSNSSAQPNISTQTIANLPICLPASISEQQKIADFLDKKCSHIDSVLDKTKASIEEYKKLKQAVITQAVTKGIRPNRPMKDSGIEWIGEIPEDWEIKFFRNIFIERNEKNIPIKTKERLSLSIDKGVTLYNEKTTNLDRFKEDFTQYKLAYENDFVLNSMNMIVGAVGVSKYFGCVSPVYYTYYSNEQPQIASFYEYIFKTKLLNRKLYSLGRGIYAIERGDNRVNTCRLKISKDDLKSLKLPYPPIREQMDIIEYLSDKCAEIDKLIEKKEQLISELETYKKSLIYEYVTGKKEVC